MPEATEESANAVGAAITAAGTSERETLLNCAFIVLLLCFPSVYFL